MSQILSMDFESSKPAFIDPSESFYMDYLQYDHSPSFGVGIGLPTTASPLAFNNLTLSSGVGGYTYSSNMGAASPARPFTPPDGASISPHNLTYDLSGGEVHSDPSSGRASRGSQRSSPGPSAPSPGPATVPYPSTVPRSHRFNPMAPATTSRPTLRHKRRASRTDDTDDEDEDFQPPITAGTADSRRETIRKQRIESEQRRRDELRDGYARLRENLPASNQKASKVSILDRATGHIRYLETLRDQLELRLKSAEAEVHRLRNVNEALMLGAASRAQAATGLVGSF